MFFSYPHQPSSAIPVQLVGELGEFPWEVEVIHFSPDGTLLAAATEAGPVQVWNRDLLQRVQSHELLYGDSLAHVGFSPPSHLHVTSFIRAESAPIPSPEQDGVVRVWHSDGHITSLADHQGGARGVACTPDGQCIVTTDAAQRVRLWKLSTAALLQSWQWQDATKHSPHALADRQDVVVFSSKGTFLALTCDPFHRHIQLWSYHPLELSLVLAEQNVQQTPCTFCTFSSDEQLFASVLKDQNMVDVVNLYTLPAFSLIDQVYIPPQKGRWGKRIMQVAFSPDNRYLALSTDDAKVWLWSRSTQQVVASWQAHTNYWETSVHAQYAQFFSLRALAWSADGTLLATGGYRAETTAVTFSVRLWHIQEAVPSLQGEAQST